jgi:uncharacterized RDD family membrane protein YckC
VALRRDLGSWLDGGERPGPGRLGLPAAGPGSLAPLGRRVVGILVDWFASLGASYALFGGNEWATLAIFGLENLLLVGTLGYTVGHRVAGLRVVRADGRTFVGPLSGLVRALLLCLVIPPVVWDADGRGLHDKGAGTVVVRR